MEMPRILKELYGQWAEVCAESLGFPLVAAGAGMASPHMTYAVESWVGGWDALSLDLAFSVVTAQPGPGLTIEALPRWVQILEERTWGTDDWSATLRGEPATFSQNKAGYHQGHVKVQAFILSKTNL